MQAIRCDTFAVALTKLPIVGVHVRVTSRVGAESHAVFCGRMGQSVGLQLNGLVPCLHEIGVCVSGLGNVQYVPSAFPRNFRLP